MRDFAKLMFVLQYRILYVYFMVYILTLSALSIMQSLLRFDDKLRQELTVNNPR